VLCPPLSPQGTLDPDRGPCSPGLREFCQGTPAITNASRPISTPELQSCAKNVVTGIELPLAFDAITVVANTARELKRA
jgi:ABC-type phosphate transport system substrate-binding protein